MTEIFADTFYFVALLSPADQAHVAARAILIGRNRRLVTTAWVLTELANTLCKREFRAGFLNTVNALLRDPTAVVIGPEQVWFDAGIELFAKRSDKDWSLTNCISFIVMQERGIREALTRDHHFEQAGFNALLK